MEAHIGNEVKTAITLPQVGVKLVMISGGLNNSLQLLDTSVNQLFKAKVRAQWEDWMSSV